MYANGTETAVNVPETRRKPDLPVRPGTICSAKTRSAGHLGNKILSKNHPSCVRIVTVPSYFSTVLRMLLTPYP